LTVAPGTSQLARSPFTAEHSDVDVVTADHRETNLRRLCTIREQYDPKGIFATRW
jgi:hypothetical protein